MQSNHPQCFSSPALSGKAFSLFLSFYFLLFTFSFSYAQEFDFRRVITPFPISNLGGQAYGLPFTGGMNRPVHQFLDIDGDSDPDLFVQDQANQLTFFRNSGSPTLHEFQWVTDQFENLEVGAWFKFADADSDGDMDLFAEKPFGVIRYYKNNGSSTNPAFVLVADTLKDIAGIPILADGFSIPDWAEIDCDGDLDLFLGRQNGHITLYKMVGLNANSVPLYQHMTDTFEDILILTGGGDSPQSEIQDEFHPGNRRDGDALAGNPTVQPDGDALAGNPTVQPDGDALAGNPIVKSLNRPITQSPNDNLRHGANSLTFVDIDGDQDNDLFWGDFFANSIIYLQNLGSCQVADFDPNLIIEGYPPNDTLKTGGYNVPRFADIDGDGDWDMFVGVLGGAVSFISDRAENFYYYENSGSPTQPFFALRSKQFISAIDIGQNTATALVDIDSDGDLDLYLTNQEDLESPGESNSRIYFFENQGSPASPLFRLITEDYLHYDKQYDLNYAPAFADLEGDGLLDLYLGKWDGKMTRYQNQGTPTAPDFVLDDEFWGGIDIGNNNTPAFVDIDDDGDLDLIIGEFSGNLNFYRNTGSPTAPVFELVDPNYFGIDVGDYSYPAFVDIDEDGDQDMILGSDTQGMLLYRNTGTPQAANFVLDPSFQLPLLLHSAPNFADIDADGDLDLFSGSRGGGIVYYENLEISTGIGPASAQNANLPEGIRLLGNFPNPFNPSTTIEYELNLSAAQSGSFHTLTIYNVLGQAVREWRIPNSPAAIRREISWDGRDAAGNPLPSGIYFYHLRVDANTSAGGKMLLAR